MNFIKKIIKSRSKEDEIFLTEIQELVGFKPNRVFHYKIAFTHSSLKKTNSKGNPLNYERLEFLGDAILGAVIAHFLFKKIPEGTEGYLTQMRSKIVSREHLNEIGNDLGLIRYVISNVPKENFGDNIHGNVFEALLVLFF